MRKFFKVLFNTISLAAVIILNGLAATSSISDATVGSVSAKYDTLFAPAGYAFSIWGFIYLMLILFVGFQWYALFSKKFTEVIDRTAGFFILANIANASWLFLWLEEWIGASVIVMGILLLSLIILFLRHKMELTDPPVRVLAFVWWPIAIYLGWIITATVANVAAYLTIFWDGDPLSPQLWTIIMIIVATGIYAFLVFKRNSREAAAVGVWAFVAIAVRQWNLNSEIAITSVATAIILSAIILYHASQNIETYPHKKLQRGEW